MRNNFVRFSLITTFFVVTFSGLQLNRDNIKIESMVAVASSSGQSCYVCQNNSTDNKDTKNTLDNHIIANNEQTRRLSPQHFSSRPDCLQANIDKIELVTNNKASQDSLNITCARGTVIGFLPTKDL